MAEITADTSSYLKPGSLKSAVDYAKDYTSLDLQNQQLQSNKLGIDNQKLDNANKALTFMTRALGSLGPNASKEDYAKVAQNAVDQGLVPQAQENTFLQRLQAAPDSKSFYNEFMTAAASHQQQLDYHLGKNGTMDTGDQVQPGVVASPAAGGGFTPGGPPINKQLPVGQPTVDNRQGSSTFGQPGVVGPRGPAFGGAPINQQVPSLKSAVAQPAPASQPGFIPTGAPPLYDEGKKLFNADQELATQKLTNAKPALLALDLLPGLRSGPGTDTWNKAVAGLKANGIISTDKANDPTAVYQEVDKYLNQYLKGRGDRSDADLQQAAKSSPNPGTQINPALLKLTQTAVAQDRIEAARAAAFKGNDFQNYGKHRSEFPAGQDERAFIVDKMTPDQKQELAKDLKKMKPEERARFVRSLKTFEDSKVSGQ